jgi:hypothetical protein
MASYLLDHHRFSECQWPQSLQYRTVYVNNVDNHVLQDEDPPSPRSGLKSKERQQQQDLLDLRSFAS